MAALLSAQVIESALTELDRPGHVYVGYSGGVDSHVLLHLCASVKNLNNKITAVYVHHGLQTAAEVWAGHCQQTAANLGVAFKLLRVDARALPGESPEEAARNARYQALQALMSANDVLLIGQHREDQLETVLLQLFRGGGLPGLSGMPERMAFGRGVMLRPLLNVAKTAISDYAVAHGLSWVDDPSNLSDDYDRNFLRNTVLPLLKQRWPSLDKTVARSARHCADAQVIVSTVAEELFLPVFNAADKTLSISRLQQHNNARQQLIIRQWFQCLGLKMPAQAVVKRIQTEVLAARSDAAPLLSTQQHCLRRYQDKLYCLNIVESTLVTGSWPNEQQSIAITEQRMIAWVSSSRGISKDLWQRARVEIRKRQGGEKIRLSYRQGRHSLKKLFQEVGIPPWERELIPLIYLDGQLAAVGDYWISSEFYCEKETASIAFSVQSITDSSLLGL